ncbi:MAG: Panacea domain-containing protein [Ignavibacteriaceae bacterium]
MKPLELSYYIINDFSSLSPDGITPLKLQKLLYYIYVWGIVSNNKVLEAEFEKWKFGPVNTEVYYHFKDLGKSQISPDYSKKVKLSSADKKFVEFIVSNYIKYNAITLSAMSHKDLPWQETPQNFTINEKSIKNFYNKLNFANNFPLGKSKYFYPVETDLHYSFILDMPSNIGKKTFYFDSYKEYLQLEKQSQKAFEKEIKEWLQ